MDGGWVSGSHGGSGLEAGGWAGGCRGAPTAALWLHMVVGGWRLSSWWLVAGGLWLVAGGRPTVVAPPRRLFVGAPWWGAVEGNPPPEDYCGERVNLPL